MNMNRYAIANIYARAFMRVSGNYLQEKETISRIRSAVRYLEAKPAFQYLLFFLSGHEKTLQKSLMNRYLQQVRLPDYFSPLCFLLIKKKQVSLLSLILSDILKLWYDKEQVQAITLYAPQVLSESEKNTLITFMEQKRNKKVIFCELVLQPNLIAGIKIVSSDEYVWEYSLLNQVKKITAILRQEGIQRE